MFFFVKSESNSKSPFSLNQGKRLFELNVWTVKAYWLKDKQPEFQVKTLKKYWEFAARKEGFFMAQFLPSIEKTIKKEARNCFNKEKEGTAKDGDLFTTYFFRNCTSEGVLFKTMKEITSEMVIPHQKLMTILQNLEKQQIIYRRNGIIGLRKYN